MFAMRVAAARALVAPSRRAISPNARFGKTFGVPTHRHRKHRVVPKNAAAEIDLDALMPDSIEGDLEGLQEEAGAVFDETGVPLSYGDTQAELETLRTKVGVVDRGNQKWRLLRLSGASAADVLVEAGAGEDAVTTLFAKGPNKGSALTFSSVWTYKKEVATCHVQAGGGLLVVAPAGVADILLQAAGGGGGSETCVDLAERCSFLSLVGPNAGALLQAAGVTGGSMDQSMGTHRTFGFEGRPVVACNGGGELFSGNETIEHEKHGVVNLIVDEGVAGLLWAAVTNLGAEPVGLTALEAWVVQVAER